MSSTKKCAYEGLKYRIITQQLAPGELLKDKDLMEQYDIGRTPLREVFIELQSEGLIKRIPRSGTWVAPMDFHFLKQVTEIRIGLEGIAGELAAERISRQQLAALTVLLEKAQALEAKKDTNYEKLMKYESDFHNVIYSATGNPQLEKLLRNYQSVGARFWHYLVFSREQMVDQFKSQQLLLNALIQCDKTTCKSISEEHIRNYIGIINERIHLG
jgi:DNA-binding GntR family transcriptional regulator